MEHYFNDKNEHFSMETISIVSSASRSLYVRSNSRSHIIPYMELELWLCARMVQPVYGMEYVDKYARKWSWRGQISRIKWNNWKLYISKDSYGYMIEVVGKLAYFSINVDYYCSPI